MIVEKSILRASEERSIRLALESTSWNEMFDSNYYSIYNQRR